MKYSIHTFTENKNFKHGILFNTMLDYHYARQWITKTYGDGVNARLLLDAEYSQIKWGYVLERYSYMIYLRDDSMLSWFILKYGESTI